MNNIKKLTLLVIFVFLYSNYSFANELISTQNITNETTSQNAKSLNIVRHGFGIKCGYENLENVLYLSNMPILQVSYERFEKDRGWSFGIGFSPNEYETSEILYLTGEENTVYFDKLSTITVGFGYQILEPIYLCFGYDIGLYSNKDKQVSFRGTKLSLEIGDTMNINESIILIPSIGLNYSFITGFILDGKSGGLNNPQSDFGFEFGVKSIFFL
jgi:hypothetical protein